MPAERNQSGATVTSTEYAQAVVVPTTTSVSMPVERWIAARQAAR